MAVARVAAVGLVTEAVVSVVWPARISNYLRSFGPMTLVRRLVPAPGLDGKLTAFG